MNKAQIIEQLRKLYPSLNDIADLPRHLNNVISEDTVRLPRTVLTRAQKVVSDIYTFAHSPGWLKELRARLIDPHLIAVFETPAPPSSVLMSYDFHYDFAKDQMSLIEINTNASMYLLASHLYEFRKIEAPTSDAPLTALKESFMQEWNGHPPKKLAIVDVDPPTQKMFFEFKIFCDLFRSWGVNRADIFDRPEVPVGEVDFVYNRLTDFYFNEPESKHLWQAWHEKHLKVSPHPREYLLLGDKQRMVDFSEKKISDVLIPATSVSTIAPEDLWAARKNLFFKPKNAFGGKAAYRGHSISTKVFNELVKKDYLAQEFRPAGEWNGLKFDLRFFVYKAEIQLMCARLYHGQMTNFSSPGGGIAPVIFEAKN